MCSIIAMLGGTARIFDLIADFAEFILLGNHTASILQSIIGPMERAINEADITPDLYIHVYV